MEHRKLEGTYVTYSTRDFMNVGVVEKSSDKEYPFIVRWLNSKHGDYSASFSEHAFYNTGHPTFETMWDILIDGSVSEQEKLAFRIKHGI